MHEFTEVFIILSGFSGFFKNRIEFWLLLLARLVFKNFF